MKIFATEDLSFITTIRTQFRIRIPTDPGDEGILEICKEITAEQPKHNALSFQFYFPEAPDDPQAHRDDAWKYRRADITVDWCPKGIWRDADTVPAGEYSTHKYAITRPGG